jgi:hypothetical protein
VKVWGACRPVTLATFRWSREARLCQGCAHSAHPQGLALIESGLHAIANVLLRVFKKSILPYLAGESFFQKLLSLAQLRQDAH